LKRTTYPTILDIDLDAFFCASDYDTYEYSNKGSKNYFENARRAYRKVMQNTLDFIDELPKPYVITIARSQTPNQFVPSNLVNEIEKQLLLQLKDLYN
jgi:hypothetical protein